MSGAAAGALIPAVVSPPRPHRESSGRASSTGERSWRRESRARASRRKVTCEECYFRRNMLCALDLPEPCATFRPHEAQLKPPPAAALRLPPGAPHARRVGLSRPRRNRPRCTLSASRIRGAMERTQRARAAAARRPSEVYWGGPKAKAPVEAVARMAAKDSIGKASAAARAAQRNQYVKRILEDEELRGNLLAAYAAARSAYGRVGNGKPPTKALFEDRKLQRELARGGGGAARGVRTRSKSPPSASAAGGAGWAARCCSRSSRACSRWRSARACARRCSTCCSGPRRSSTTARPRCRRRRRRARWAPPPPERRGERTARCTVAMASAVESGSRGRGPRGRSRASARSASWRRCGAASPSTGPRARPSSASRARRASRGACCTTTSAPRSGCSRRRCGATASCAWSAWSSSSRGRRRPRTSSA